MVAGREEVRMKLNPESLARASSRHPWRTLGIWVVLIGTMGFVSSQLLGDVLTQDIEFTNEPESVRAQEVLDERFSDGAETASTEFFIVQSDTLSVDDPRFESAVRGLQAEIAEVDGDILASDPFTYYDLAEQAPEQAAGLVSRDGRGTLIGVPLTDVELSTIEELRAVAREARPDGFTVQVAGQGVMFADFTEIAEEDLRRGESIGIAAALIIMIVVFAAVVAAIVPIVMAIFAIVVALGLVSLIGQMAEFNLFVTNMVSMIGLAVGIDYSLFIVSRYREERKKGFPKLEAIGASGATANRAVFFSGLTVVLALLGMLIIPASIFRSLAAGAILVTLASLAASMTLLPAILGLLGDRVNWPRLAKRARVDSDHDPRGGFWDRITRGVMARPVVYLLPAVAGMDVFAPETQVIPSEDGTAVEVDAFFRGDPSTNAAFQAIRDLRSDVVPETFDGVEGVEVLVGGNTAFFTDFLDVADRYQWIVLAFVLGLSFVLLTVVFGLSMDYHVFLLSRIREEYDKTRDNTEAVAYGLRTTAGIITGAALIMVAVFGGFAAGRLGPLQQMGFGLAVAVFMDGTIVRSLLVPASMRLLGDWNWYLPSWLNWLPQVKVEGHEPTMAAPEREPVSVER